MPTMSSIDQSPGTGVHELFEEQVERAPGAPAVVFGREQLPYRELNRRANRLAHRLRGLGVGPEVVVGVCLERSPASIVALLGVLKAGGAYLPLDPVYPGERIAFMLADCGAEALVTTRAQREQIPSHGARVVLRMDGDEHEIASQPDGNPPRTARLANLAYVIYTSGSTGAPKGVMVPHASLASYVRHAVRAFGLEPADRVLQFASLGFDTSAEEIFPCLASGALLVLRTDDMLDTVPGFLDACGGAGVSVLDLPTAYWHELATSLARRGLALPQGVRLVVIGGERALPERLVAWRQAVAGVRLLNTYGPTEATIVALSCDLEAVPEGVAEVPIGVPVTGAEALVLDHELGPVSGADTGELFIGGPGVARGYRGRPDLTAERFVPDPRPGRPHARLYRTGDLVRRGEGGDLEFVGRADDQVKLRGYRVEPGEVETALAAHPGVRAVAVRPWSGGSAGARLAAYVVPARPDLTSAELRAYLGARLPQYMLPASYLALERLPLTPGGKLDRAALPPPDTAGSLGESTYVAPRTHVEEVLAGLYQEVLGIPRVGLHDDFFELGGHSLAGVQLLFQVREVLGVELPLRTVFQLPKVADLATVVARRAHEVRGSSSLDAQEVLDRLDDLSADEIDTLLDSLSAEVEVR